MSQKLERWCNELLEKATGTMIKNGEDMYEPEHRWKAFASRGYRNTDVVNSMIAFFYINGDIPMDIGFNAWSSCNNRDAVKAYMVWARQHIDEEDWDDVEDKAWNIIGYIAHYRFDPKSYLIVCNYLSYNELAEF